MIKRVFLKLFLLAFLLGVLARSPTSDFKIVCFQTINQHSDDSMHDIETDLCTHIIYYQIELNPTSFCNSII